MEMLEDAPELDVEAVRALAPDRLFGLDGAVTLITGAAGGIGRWLAAGLGAAGGRLVLTDVAGPALDEVAAALRAAGVEVEAAPADLRADDAPERLVAAATDAFGRLDVLVNCAAVNRRMPILEVDRDTYDLIMDLDLRVPYFLSQAAARVMARSGGGAIVNVGSINVAVGLEDVSVYGPAKAGLAQLTKVMAVEWSSLGIRANCLCPGFIMTPLSAPVWRDPARGPWMHDRIPQRRPGLPADLVGACLLLASPAGAYLTGQAVFVDGGFLAGSPWSGSQT